MRVCFLSFLLMYADSVISTRIWGLIIIIILNILMSLPAHSGPWPLIQFRNHIWQKVGLLRRAISQSQCRYLNTGQHKHRTNAYAHQTSMPWVGFEPTIPASKRAKTVHTLECAATVIGCGLNMLQIKKFIIIIIILFNVCSSTKNCPSARCAAAANVVCREVDVFGTGTFSLNVF
jgi:hypothetical protein